MNARRFHQGALTIALATLVGVACKSSSGDASSPVSCTPGAYVFCRCEDRSDGTKLCHDDGASFDECVCESAGDSGLGGERDGALGDGKIEPVDSGGPVTGATLPAACIGKLGVVAGAGADTDLDAYVATYTGSGVFAVSKSHGPGLRGPVTILPVGATLVATYLSRFELVAWTKLEASTWSSPISVGSASAVDTTSASLINGQLRLFYLGDDGLFHMGVYTAGVGWDDATALAEAADAGTPIPGPSAPATAVVGSSVTLAFTGNDGTLARENFASGSWGAITKFAGPLAFQAAPALVALDAGAVKDLLMVYGGSDLLLHVVTRDASNKVWNAATLFDTAASSTEIALGSLPGGKAMLVYKASNDQGYYSVWSPTTGFGPPAELVPGANPTLASVPSITRGTCGSDATIAYAQADGAVKILTYAASVLAGPYDVGGIPKATYVGVGELP